MLSASQISTFRDCPRKWAFDKLDGVPRKESFSANEGTAIHAEVEDYYVNGNAPSRPEALALMTHLPQPSPSLVAEQEFSFVWPGENALVRGYMDLFCHAPLKVWDHKTTSSKRYFKTVEDLMVDPQATIYGLAARLLENAMREDVELQWTYVIREQPKTRAPHTHVVAFTQTTDMLYDAMNVLNPSVSELVQIASASAKAKDVPANSGDPCFRYGGCPYKDLCADYAGHKKEAIQMPDNDLLALLRAASNAVEVPSEPVPPAPIPAATPSAGPAPAMPLMDTSAVSEAVTVQVVPPDAQPNVSESDPPPPPTEAPKRGRPKAKTDGAPAPAPPLPSPSAPDRGQNPITSPKFEGNMSPRLSGPVPTLVPTPAADPASAQTGNLDSLLRQVLNKAIDEKAFDVAFNTLNSIRVLSKTPG